MQIKSPFSLIQFNLIGKCCFTLFVTKDYAASTVEQQKLRISRSRPQLWKQENGPSDLL